MALRDIRLWLHDGTPAGARTVFEGDAFVSILGADDAAREALALLGGREAVTVFAGPDAMPGRLVAAVVSGDVREAAAGCLPENGRTPFTSVVVLGAPGAAHLEYAIRAAVASSGGVTFLDGVEAQEEAGPLPAAWTSLAAVAGGAPAWLAERHDVRDGDCARAFPGLPLSCTGRGAQARARLVRGGILILAGSRCSPSDATPSLIAPIRDAIKRLVDAGDLEKRDGVWTFVRDVSLASPVQAASIVMRTSAGAAAWETEDGDTLAERLAPRHHTSAHTAEGRDKP